MQKPIAILVAGVLLLAGGQLAESVKKYSGDRLSQDEPQAAEQGFQAAQIEVLGESRRVHLLVFKRQYEEALALAQKLIEKVKRKLETESDSGEQQRLSQFLFSVYQAKIRAHYQSNQLFEALLNSVRIRSLCHKYGCTRDQLLLLKTIISELEKVVKTKRPADALGIAASDARNASKLRIRRLKLMALLHPDKNMDLDEEARKELGTVFDLAKKSFEELLAQ